MVTPGPGPVKARLCDGADTTPDPFPPEPAPAPPDPLLAVEGVGDVVLDDGGTVVVEVDPPPAMAITGAIGLPGGVTVVVPEGTVLLG